jgi:hypothetical protein
MKLSDRRLVSQFLRECNGRDYPVVSLGFALILARECGARRWHLSFDEKQPDHFEIFKRVKGNWQFVEYFDVDPDMPGLTYRTETSRWEKSVEA